MWVTQNYLHVCKERLSSQFAVNPGVLCTLNARNALSQHGVHDEQTVTLLSHYMTQTCLHVCKERLSSQTSKPSAISVGAHTSKQNTHTIFTSLSFPLYSVHEPYFLHFYCTQRVSQISLCHTSHRGCCTSLVSENMSTN